MKTTISIIDVGTNTFHILIIRLQAGRNFHILHKERIPVKLGEKGISKGIIDDTAFDRGIETLKYFKNISDKFNVSTIHAVATSGIRSTTNGVKFVEQIKKQTGINIKVISGEEEARLIYKGINFTLNLGKYPILIIDIGGGSVEFIIGNEEKIFWTKSYEIGAQRLLDRFHTNDPIPTEQIAKMNEFLEENLQELTDKIKEYGPRIIIGASGAFETFSDIYFKEQNPSFLQSEVTETDMDYSLCEQIYNQLISSTREERLKIPGMVEFRADMIVVSAILVYFFLKKFKFSAIRVSNAALKEGVLAELLEETITDMDL